MDIDNTKLIDQCDIAEQEIQRELERALSNHSLKKRLTHTGKCLYCEEKVKEGLFCDIECRDDYEFLEKRGKV